MLEQCLMRFENSDFASAGFKRNHSQRFAFIQSCLNDSSFLFFSVGRRSTAASGTAKTAKRH
jgi:hypothetical protein